MRSDVSEIAGCVTPAEFAGCQVRAVESPVATELYITATPGSGTPQQQAYSMYVAIAQTLREQRALVVHERLFAAAAAAMPAALAARAAAYGELDDGVPPVLLTTRGQHSQIIGVQVHAIRGIARPLLIHNGPNAIARRFECDGYAYLTATGLRDTQLRAGPAAARAVFESADQLLRQAGASFRNVARTWIWMDDILSWYGEFNRVRNEFFAQAGLFDTSGTLPASTGIGVSPAAAPVAMDVFAAWGKADAVTKSHAAGNQRSPHEYGSAFARASRVKTPGGVTIFCSGTAAIDATGKTCFIDDIAGQVRMTIDNVLAVLQQMSCLPADVVQAMAYCATPQVQRYFETHWRDTLPWPCLIMTADVCRADLLFEMEVTACHSRGDSVPASPCI